MTVFAFYSTDTSNTETAVNNIATDDLYDRLDRSVPSQPPPPASLAPKSERSQPEGAYFQISVKSDTPRKIEHSGPLEEVLYDTPMVIVSKPQDNSADLSLKDITNPKLLFDDPGYTEGMMAAELAQKQSTTQGYQYIASIGEYICMHAR